MFFVYKPGGDAADRKWEFAPDKLMNPEAEAIERVTGMTFGEWIDAVPRGSITALHALLWVMMKREDPTLTYESVQFSLSQLDMELSDEESAEALAGLEERAAKGENLSPSDLALLTTLRESAPPKPAVKAVPKESGEDAPKARAS